MNSRMGTIATKEVADAIRSRLVWLLVGAVVIVAIPQVISLQSLDQTTASATRSIAIYLQPIVPLLGIVVGYQSVVGERESGSLRILLGLPGTREDVILGKILGRSVVFVVTALAGMVCTGVVVRLISGGIDIPAFIGVSVFVLLFGLAWVGIGVGLSALVATRFRAIVGAVGLYALFNLFWDSLVLPFATYLFTGSASTASLALVEVAPGPEWYIYFQRLNPTKAFKGGYFDVSQVFESSASIPPVDLFGIGTLIVWFVLPVAIGYWRFNRADLG